MKKINKYVDINLNNKYYPCRIEKEDHDG